MTRPKTETLAALPPPWSEDPLPRIRDLGTHQKRTLVVLDDDPTGTQTVYDVPVLTEWSVNSLRRELQARPPGFYLLTNSRSLPLTEAQRLNREIATNLLTAANVTAKDPHPFTVVSRSDSTLRGHFPGETQALSKVLGDVHATLVIPFFEAGGRFTIDDVHYVAEGDTLVPAADTPFARDAAFGYRHSNLRDWVAEKCGDPVRAEQVASLSLAGIRQGGPTWVRDRLLALTPTSYCVVNAVSQRDMEVLVQGLLEAETQGKRFLFRTAASFVAARLGLAPRPLLGTQTLSLPSSSGGLFVVGSYVPKTTEQLRRLVDSQRITLLELDVQALLSDPDCEPLLAQTITETNHRLKQGQDVVVATSRHLLTANDPDESLRQGRRISRALVQIVRGLEVCPRYLVAKGGITSSDLATEALGVRRAMVRGQILPGVPVWELGPETRFPGLSYIVFPGNVGGPEALDAIRQKLSGPTGNAG